MFVLALAIAVFLATPAAAEPAGKITRYGIYKIFRTGKYLPAKRTPSGVLSVFSNFKHLRKADVIGATLGRSFGFEFDVSGLPEDNISVTVRIRHPPKTNPKTGRPMATSIYVKQLGLRRTGHFVGFTFDYTWEMAEGWWIWEIVYRGKVIVAKRFKIVVPMN